MVDAAEVQLRFLAQTCLCPTLETQVRADYRYLVPMAAAPPGTVSSREVYREEGSLRRFYSKRILSESGAPGVQALVGYFQGGRAARLGEAGPGVPRRITISRDFLGEQSEGFSSKPSFLAFRDVGLTPLHEAVTVAVREGSETICDRSCTIFRFDNVAGARATQTLVYSLDDKTAAPLKVVAYPAPYSGGSKPHNWDWEAIEVARVGDFLYPKRSRYTSYLIDGPNATPKIVEEQIVERLELGVAFRDADFWPTFRPGDLINDLIERKSYEYRPAGTPKGGAPKASIAAVSDPIRVDDAASGWTSLGGFAWLWLGCALIAAGLALRSRSRRAGA